MNARTLLKISATDHCIVFRIITWTQKSSPFYATCDELAKLGRKCEVISYDGTSFKAHIVQEGTTMSEVVRTLSVVHGMR